MTLWRKFRRTIGGAPRRRKAEQVRMDFVANVSHELRTPLTSIKGYAATIRDELQAKRYDMIEKYLGVLIRNVDRLSALVDDLLNLSSLESGVELHMSMVNLEELTDRIIEELREKFDNKKQAISYEINASTLIADAKLVEQVLINLIENASKYSPEGTQIRILWESGEGGSVILKVIDNGPGIPEEHHERLFERFYRVDKARSREMGGTGLGLAIVKHVMQRHGGSILVESGLGLGTTFICRFPNLEVF